MGTMEEKKTDEEEEKMKGTLWAVLSVLYFLFCGEAAQASEMQIAESLPAVTIAVTDAGSEDDALLHPHRLRVSIAAQDGSIRQELIYRSTVSAAHDGAALLTRLQDVNFDGYQDLMLLTAQGARNVYYAVSLFDPEMMEFMPVMQTCAWSMEKKAFHDEVTQLELCNPMLLPETREILSCEEDGFRYRTEIVYQWEVQKNLEPTSVLDVYDAGEGMIGELLEQRGTQVCRCWDEVYPESWYYGQERVVSERREAYLELLNGWAAPKYTRVANVSWVHLRKQDSKASPSLAKLDERTVVQVLREGCGEDGGWVRVYIAPETWEETGLTGYIWHSFLEDMI